MLSFSAAIKPMDWVLLITSAKEVMVLPVFVCL